MSKHLTPVAVLERLIGPLDVLAAVAGKHGKSPYLWRRASKWRDEGDLPSARDMRTFLDYAAARRIPLTADMLIRGASAEEIAALIERRAPGFEGHDHVEAAE